MSQAMDGEKLVAGSGGEVNVDMDRAGAFKLLMFNLSCFYCVGCIICCPCAKCYTDTQSVKLDDKSISLSYDMGICGNSTKSIPLDRIQDITV